MTPEQIEVGGYYVIDPGTEYEVQFKVTRVDITIAYGFGVYPNEIIDYDGWEIQALQPSTREAFNAAVDRVVSKVKGEA